MINPGRLLRVLSSWLLAVGLVSAVGSTQVLGDAKPLVNTPVYYAPAKSYFALVDFRGTGHFRNWIDAARYAANQSYKGTRGHLAVIDSPELHEFLRKTFRPRNPTWIGLRYWCTYGKSQWITGATLRNDEFAIWNRPWDLSGRGPNQKCPDNYLAIYYTPVDQGFRWAAQSANKNWKFYFVQYPTGQE